MRVRCRRRPQQVAKKIKYTVKNVKELALILAEVGDDVELRFTFEDMTLIAPWYRPRVTHWVMTTRKYGGKTLIAGMMDGGYTKIENMADVLAEMMPVTPLDEPSLGDKVKVYERFLGEYLQQFNAWQAILMTTEVVSCS